MMGDGMDGMMWGMGIVGLLILIVLVLAIAALIKYLVSLNKAPWNSVLHRSKSLTVRERNVPKVMAGLLPIMSGTGSEVMQRIAVPMIGGMVSSTLLTLIVIPGSTESSRFGDYPLRPTRLLEYAPSNMFPLNEKAGSHRSEQRRR